jgi:nucleotide-binding universal stress UspA family protein
MAQRLVFADCGVDECYSYHRHGSLRFAGFTESGVASHHGRLTMYRTILVTLDGTTTDRAIIEHMLQFAGLMHSRVVLLHVADGWAARTYGADAVSPEVTEDRSYLERVRAEFQAAGIPAETELAYGEPGDEIVKWVREKGCDLIAMSTHGHRLLSDLLRGSASRKVRHAVDVPVLLLRAPRES